MSLVFLGLLCMVFCLRGLGIVLMRSVSLARSNNHTSQSKCYLFNSPCGSIRLALSLAGSLQLQTPKIKSGLFLKNRLFFGFWYFGGLLTNHGQRKSWLQSPFREPTGSWPVTRDQSSGIANGVHGDLLYPSLGSRGVSHLNRLIPSHSRGSAWNSSHSHIEHHKPIQSKEEIGMYSRLNQGWTKANGRLTKGPPVTIENTAEGSPIQTCDVEFEVFLGFPMLSKNCSLFQEWERNKKYIIIYNYIILYICKKDLQKEHK